MKFTWEYADLTRKFHINTLCKIFLEGGGGGGGANRVNYGQLENREWGMKETALLSRYVRRKNKG